MKKKKKKLKGINSGPNMWREEYPFFCVISLFSPLNLSFLLHVLSVEISRLLLLQNFGFLFLLG